jgi:cobalt-zinc-cadmium efflux system outer membrane protein
MAHGRLEMKNNSLRRFSVRLISALTLATTSLMAQQFIPPQNPVTAAQRLSPASGTSQAEQSQKGHEAPANRSGGMTLEELQRMAFANNPTLGQAKAGVSAAAGRTLQAGLWPNPTIGYVGEEIRGGSYGGGQHGVFIQQNVILGSKLDLDRKVRSEEGKQAAAEAEEQRLRVENGVRIAFYQSLVAQQMLETRKALSDIAKDAVDTTQQLFNVGQADQPDVLQAQVEADEADLAVIAAEQEQQRAWRVLTSVVGKPAMELTNLAGDLEDLPQINADEVIETILRDSPAVKIAQLESSRADLALARANRETVPDISVRAGYLNNREDVGSIPPKVVGSEGFAEVGLNLRIFNRNQGNISAAKADRERARFEVQRVSLTLRRLAAPVLQNYSTSRSIVERYKGRTLPNAQKAYELYLHKYHEGAAAYPQVLIAQRTLFQLQTAYISALENAWMGAAALQGLLLTDALDLPATPGELDRPVREINIPVAETPGTPR